MWDVARLGETAPHAPTHTAAAATPGDDRAPDQARKEESMGIDRRSRPRWRMATLVVTGLIALGAAASAGATTGGSPASSQTPAKKVHQTTFSLFPNTSVLACEQANGKTAKATATVTRGSKSDTMVLSLSGFKPHLAFDMFTVQNSNQLSNGDPDPNFKNFGLAWYQSDVETDSDGSTNVKIKTILLDQIFGFDPAVGLDPTNTFHVGFWFNDPDDAAACGFSGFTPFNGEHHAGPVAFITRPDAVNNLGPLCTDPAGPGVCNP
jgi:hypothetical protein